MARSTKLALVILFAGLLSFTSVAPVSANSQCTGFARENCEQTVAAEDAVIYRVETVVAARIPTGNGYALEHLEAIVAGQGIATPMRLLSCIGVAREHCEVMTAQTANR
jgi:hypothetical protein